MTGERLFLLPKSALLLAWVGRLGSSWVKWHHAAIMRRASAHDRPDTSGVRVLAGGKIILRAHTDNLPQQWWFASTAIPLIAATVGPLCNVLSIAALVSPWRLTLPNDGVPFSTGRGSEDAAVGIADPEWCDLSLKNSP